MTKICNLGYNYYYYKFLHYLITLKTPIMIRNFTQKILFATLILLGASTVSAQALLNEDFNFTGRLTDNGWTAHSGITDPIVTTNGLSYPGYAASSLGNNAAFINNVNGEDVNIGFTKQNTDFQDVYYSFLVNVTDGAITKAGTFFIHLGSKTDSTFSSFTARVFAKIVADKVNFGISNGGDATKAIYSTTNYNKNTTYLVVVKYKINITGRNPVDMWVFQSGVPASETAAGDPSAKMTTMGGVDSVSGIALRQGSTSSVRLVVDAIRVGKNWADLVTPSGGPLPIKLDYLKGQRQSNGNSLNWKVTCTSLNIAMELERSSDSRNFKSVNAITATQARCSQPFDFTDAQPLQGNNFYRLKMIDVDGKISYSPIVLILNGGKTFEFVGLYPSLVNNETVVSISSDKATTIESRISDMHGRTLKSFKRTIPTGSSLITVDCSNLSAGIYNYTGISADGTTKTLRFVKL